MTNQLFIDVDTERDNPIVFSKPSNISLPQTKEEEAKVLVNDVISLAHALKLLIQIAGHKGYADKSKLVDGVVKTVIEALIQIQEPNEPKENPEGSSTEETKESV